MRHTTKSHVTHDVANKVYDSAYYTYHREHKFSENSEQEISDLDFFSFVTMTCL